MFRHVIFFVDLQFYCLVDMHQRLHPLTDRVEASIKGVEYFKDIFDMKQKHYWLAHTHSAMSVQLTDLGKLVQSQSFDLA